MKLNRNYITPFISLVFLVVGISEKLKENGLSIEEATTIEDIWINNDSNPEKVIDLIME